MRAFLLTPLIGIYVLNSYISSIFTGIRALVACSFNYVKGLLQFVPLMLAVFAHV